MFATFPVGTPEGCLGSLSTPIIPGKLNGALRRAVAYNSIPDASSCAYDSDADASECCPGSLAADADNDEVEEVEVHAYPHILHKVAELYLHANFLALFGACTSAVGLS